MIFDARDYETLHALTFAPDYPHKPKDEIPNGDGKVDAGKRYRHVALKYLAQDADSARAIRLNIFLLRAHSEAQRVAEALGVPSAFWPCLEASALRVLEYPPGVGGHRHTDFDLFALNLWRDPQLHGWPPYHLGEIAELIGLGAPHPHEVPAHPCSQRSLVYFALPKHEAVLPSGATVGEWLAERYGRSRTS